jgi:hypothetical protein
MMAADFGAKRGSDDEKQYTTDPKDAYDGRQGVVGFSLVGQFMFDLDQPLLGRVFLLVEPTPMDRRDSGREQEHDDEFDEDVFHVVRGGK